MNVFKAAQNLRPWRRERPGVVDPHSDTSVSEAHRPASESTSCHPAPPTVPLAPVMPSPGPSVPTTLSPQPACLASGLDSQDRVLGGRNSGRKEKVTYRLNAPDCKLSPDNGPGHMKSSTQSNSLSPSLQTPSPGQAPSS